MYLNNGEVIALVNFLFMYDERYFFNNVASRFQPLD